MEVKKVSEESFVGGIAGTNENKIIDCKVNNIKIDEVFGTESTDAYLGGVVGANIGKISGCSVDGMKVFEVSERSNIGGIVGFSPGEISGCSVDEMEVKKVLKSSSIGGIAGTVGTSKVVQIIDCEVKNIKIDEISGEGVLAHVGGIVGYSPKGEIKNCIVDEIEVKKVLKSSFIGGIAGTNGNKIIDCKVKNIKIDEISGEGVLAYVGGIVGYSPKGEIEKCIVDEIEVKKVLKSSFIGGIVGLLEKSNEKSKIENCESKMRVSKETKQSESIFKGGIIGVVNLGELSNNISIEFKNCYYKDVEEKTNEGLNTIGGYINKDGVKALVEEEIYQIKTKKDLIEFANRVNNGENSLNAVLCNNIDLSGSIWCPIGNEENNYNGSFNGSKYTISNIMCGDGNKGLFGVIGTKGLVKDLTVKNVRFSNIAKYIDKYELAGGIAGSNSGEIRGCSVDGMEVEKVLKKSFVGGIAGENHGKVTNCNVTNFKISEVSAKEPKQVGEVGVGGIVGYNGKEIIECNVKEMMIGRVWQFSMVGGIAGNNEGNIDNCYIANLKFDLAMGEQGKVVMIGGVVGLCQKGKINKCSVYKMIVQELSSCSDVGGIMNASTLVSIIDCVADLEVEKVSGSSNSLGGIAGVIRESIGSIGSTNNIKIVIQNCVSKMKIGKNVMKQTQVQKGGIIGIVLNKESVPQTQKNDIAKYVETKNCYYLKNELTTANKRSKSKVLCGIGGQKEISEGIEAVTETQIDKKIKEIGLIIDK